MKCTILHETRGRMRVHTMQGAMSLQQADILEAYLNRVSGVTKRQSMTAPATRDLLWRAAGNGYKGALVLCLCQGAGARAGAQQPRPES